MLLACRSSLRDSLFAAQSAEEQTNLWNRHWKSAFWSLGLKLFGMRFLWKYIFSEPGIHLVRRDFNISRYMEESFDKIMTRTLARDNAYLSLLFYGKYIEGIKLPEHLQEINFSCIKENLHRVSFEIRSLQEISEKKFDCFSLSDFSSYADSEQYSSVWRAVFESARPDARFCERRFLAQPQDPEEFFPQQLKRDRNLEDKLNKNDKSFIYTFVCGVIKPC